GKSSYERSGSSIAIASGLEWIKLSRVMDSVGLPTLMDRPVEGTSKGSGTPLIRLGFRASPLSRSSDSLDRGCPLRSECYSGTVHGQSYLPGIEKSARTYRMVVMGECMTGAMPTPFSTKVTKSGEPLRLSGHRQSPGPKQIYNFYDPEIAFFQQGRKQIAGPNASTSSTLIPLTELRFVFSHFALLAFGGISANHLHFMPLMLLSNVDDFGTTRGLDLSAYRPFGRFDGFLLATPYSLELRQGQLHRAYLNSKGKGLDLSL
ncbi:leucine-rich repeat transmembrane protein kinase, partial [Striga asiatica]